MPFGAALAQAQTPPPADTAALLQRLEEAEQRLRVLERKLELQDEATTTAAAAAPAVRASPTRFSIGTTDGANFVRLRGVAHVDGRHFEGDNSPVTSNTWLLRRVRPMIEGTFANIYDFRFTPDFAQGRTVLQDAYVTARFRPWAAVTVGKFKVPDRPRAHSVRERHALRRARVPDFARAESRHRHPARRRRRRRRLQLQRQLHQRRERRRQQPRALPTPDVENDAKGDVSARVFFQPFLELRQLRVARARLRHRRHLRGRHGQRGEPAAARRTARRARPRSSAIAATRRPPARRPPSTTRRLRMASALRYSPQFYYYFNNFGVLGEYAVVSQDVTRTNGAVTRSDTLDHKAWQLQFAWLLTGEEETFRGVDAGARTSSWASRAAAPGSWSRASTS